MKKIYIVALAVIIVLGLGFWIYRSRASTTSDVTYRSVQASRVTIANTILSTGSVKPVTRIDIKPSIAGRAERVLVNEGDHVHKNQVLAMTSSTERAALLDSARERGAAELKKWEELEKPIPILAPIDGEIILRAIEPGQTFATTDAILSMSDKLMVEALVDETDIAQVKKDQAATIVLDAYPDAPVVGKVYKIAYDATTTNNVTTYHVDVIPDKTPDFMRSGMTANVTFEISRKDNVVSVPTEAIKTRKGHSIVLEPAADPRDPPNEVEVSTGMTDGKNTEITSGVKDGDTVLIAVAKTQADKAGTNPFMPSRMGGKKPPAH